MNRLASLDYLRGVAALAVAIPHYLILGSQDWPAAQVVSFLAVEVFFGLSGFVLAAQIIHCLTSGVRSDIGVFLVRRWMRTVPPYLLALAIVTILTGNIYGSAFWSYVFYIQNLFASLPEKQDYFAVAWSLSVEEWFYVVFALLVAVSRGARLRLPAFIIVCAIFVCLVSVLRLAYGDMTQWDAGVRRVTAFRLDAIAFGFLLFCGMERIDFGLRGSRRIVLVCLLAVAAVCAFFAGWQASVGGSALWRHLYPFTATLFASLAIASLVAFRRQFQATEAVAQTGFFLGKISYTTYLFHIPVILVLRPLVTPWPMAFQLALYLGVLTSFCAAFYYAFEAPILRARPAYANAASPKPSGSAALHEFVARLAANVRTSSRKRQLATLSILPSLIAAIALTARFQDTGRQLPFYLGLVGATALLCGLLVVTEIWRFGLLRTPALALLFFALLLPPVDMAFSRSSLGQTLAPPRPVYSFREANGNPAAFTAWWAQYNAEWQRSRAGTELPDPQKTLPWLPRPNSRATFFQSQVRINNFGFRGADIDAQKDGRYRIFVIGESPTFGTMIRNDDLSWPDALGQLVSEQLSCRRQIEVINAGVAGYNLVNSLERLRRTIVPLQPDMVISYHGYNSIELVDPDMARLPKQPQFHFTGSLLLSEVRFRARALHYGEQMRQISAENSPLRYSGQYRELYTRFIEMGAAHGFQPVLANLSLAITAASPRDVIDFYGRVFNPIDRILPATAEHNRIVEAVAQQHGARFVDTRPGLEGEWDQDYFLDVVHFTDKGARRMAQKIFLGILPALESDSGPGCISKP